MRAICGLEPRGPLPPASENVALVLGGISHRPSPQRLRCCLASYSTRNQCRLLTDENTCLGEWHPLNAWTLTTELWALEGLWDLEYDAVRTSEARGSLALSLSSAKPSLLPRGKTTMSLISNDLCNTELRLHDATLDDGHRLRARPSLWVELPKIC